MKSILEELYYTHLETTSTIHDENTFTQAYNIFNTLLHSCNQKQKELLVSFDDLKNQLQCDQGKSIFISGVQHGFQLFFELLGKDFFSNHEIK